MESTKKNELDVLSIIIIIIVIVHKDVAAKV